MAVTTPGSRAPTAAANPLVRLGAAGLGAIWLAVLLISLLSPDMITGSEQQHVPIAAVLTWIWALFASRSLVTALAAERDHPEQLAALRLLVAGVAAVWIGAAALATLVPPSVTGSDPTQIPIASILAPIAATVITTTACQLFTTITGTRQRRS